MAAMASARCHDDIRAMHMPMLIPFRCHATPSRCLLFDTLHAARYAVTLQCCSDDTLPRDMSAIDADRRAERARCALTHDVAQPLFMRDNDARYAAIDTPCEARREMRAPPCAKD